MPPGLCSAWTVAKRNRREMTQLQFWPNDARVLLNLRQRNSVDGTQYVLHKRMYLLLHTSLAISTTSFSLAHCSSSLRTLPSLLVETEQVSLVGEGANSPFSAALSRHIGTPELEVQQMLTRVRAESSPRPAASGCPGRACHCPRGLSRGEVRQPLAARRRIPRLRPAARPPAELQQPRPRCAKRRA
jgi:hypothetical protein